MDPIVTAGLVAGGVSLLNNGFNLYSNERANERNLDLWRMQADHQQKLWMMNNEYNSPSAQMSRLASAGLSPHLVYGKGAITPSSLSSTPGATPVAPGRLEIDPNIALAIGQARLQATQVRKIESDMENERRVTEANVSKTNAETNKIVKDTELTDKHLSWYDVNQQAFQFLNSEQVNNLRFTNYEMARLHELKYRGYALDNEIKEANVSSIISQERLSWLNYQIFKAKTDKDMEAIAVNIHGNKQEQAYFESVKDWKLIFDKAAASRAEQDVILSKLEEELKEVQIQKGKVDIMEAYGRIGKVIFDFFNSNFKL